MKLTNRTFAKNDDIFKKCCQEANIPDTKRQASKFRRNKGKAYKVLEKLTNHTDEG